MIRIKRLQMYNSQEAMHICSIMNNFKFYYVHYVFQHEKSWLNKFRKRVKISIVSLYKVTFWAKMYQLDLL